MNTYDYMYDVLKLRGEININFQQLVRLMDEGIPFTGGYVCSMREGLTLECAEAKEFEKELNNIIQDADVSAPQVVYITDTWKWLYLLKEYARGTDGGVHFMYVSFYYKEVEEDDN